MHKAMKKHLKMDQNYAIVVHNFWGEGKFEKLEAGLQ
jgi:hypothetical protein